MDQIYYIRESEETKMTVTSQDLATRRPKFAINTHKSSWVEKI